MGIIDRLGDVLPLPAREESPFSLHSVKTKKDPTRKRGLCLLSVDSLRGQIGSKDVLRIKNIEAQFST